MALSTAVRFVRDEAQLSEFLISLKLIRCPHCKRAQTLNAHGPLRGYADQTSELVIRGWRVYCTNRRGKLGCGRTFSALLADVLRRFIVRAHTLLTFVSSVLGGANREAAWNAEAPGFSLRSGYRLWKRLSEQQPVLRSLLCRHTPPVRSTSPAPLHALLQHMQAALPDSASVFRSFQIRFQHPLMG